MNRNMPLTDDELLELWKKLAIDAFPTCGKHMSVDTWNRWYGEYNFLLEQMELRELDKD